MVGKSFLSLYLHFIVKISLDNPAKCLTVSLFIVDCAEHNQTRPWTRIYQEIGAQHVHYIYTKERIQVFLWGFFCIKTCPEFADSDNFRL